MFGELIVSECKVMNSAKKPLWLVWKNHDPLAEIQYQRNAIIFKNGDDLRRDMLTLQVIKIMDHIWHMEGKSTEESLIPKVNWRSTDYSLVYIKLSSIL